jgi:hypothetical protein
VPSILFEREAHFQTCWVLRRVDTGDVCGATTISVKKAWDAGIGGACAPGVQLKDLILRFVIGGVVVSAFAALGDVLKPKSFAGLFGAAPSIALATLGLTIASKGKMYAATEGRSMIAGALAFFLYAYVCSWLMLRLKVKAMVVTISALGVWLVCAVSIWFLVLR